MFHLFIKFFLWDAKITVQEHAIFFHISSQLNPVYTIQIIYFKNCFNNTLLNSPRSSKWRLISEFLTHILRSFLMSLMFLRSFTPLVMIIWILFHGEYNFSFYNFLRPLVPSCPLTSYICMIILYFLHSLTLQIYANDKYVQKYSISLFCVRLDLSGTFTCGSTNGSI